MATSDVADSMRLLKGAGGEHGRAGRAKARLVANGYSQTEGVDFFYTLGPTASATSDRLVEAMACTLDLDLRHSDVGQSFIQCTLDTESCLRLRWGGVSLTYSNSTSLSTG